MPECHASSFSKTMHKNKCNLVVLFQIGVWLQQNTQWRRKGRYAKGRNASWKPLIHSSCWSFHSLNTGETPTTQLVFPIEYKFLHLCQSRCSVILAGYGALRGHYLKVSVSAPAFLFLHNYLKGYLGFSPRQLLKNTLKNEAALILIYRLPLQV